MKKRTTDEIGTQQFRTPLKKSKQPTQNENERRVELNIRGQWGTVCDSSWNAEAASVICRQLGYGRGKPRSGAAYGKGVGPTWMVEVRCDGTESTIQECTFGSWGRVKCVRGNDVGIICSWKNARLSDGSSDSEGRVEVYHNGEWGTVSDDSWEADDARVLCRQLGYADGIAKSTATFGRGGGRIWMDDVSCDGSESRIHNKDAGVVLTTHILDFFADVRLVNGGLVH